MSHSSMETESHTSVGTEPMPQNIKDDINQVDDYAKLTIEVLNKISDGKYSNPQDAQDAWNDVMVPFSRVVGKFGSDVNALHDGSLKTRLKPLQDALNEICMSMDQGMFGANYSPDGARAALNLWNNGNPDIGLPSGVQILKDLS